MAVMEANTVLLKVLNNEEIHHGYQYKEGLNKLPEGEKFNDDETQSCAPGGFYFSNLENIHEFLHMGTHLRKIEIPPGTKIVKDPNGTKSRADRIIIRERIEYADFLLLDRAKDSTSETEKRNIYNAIYPTVSNSTRFEKLAETYPDLMDEKYTKDAIDATSAYGHVDMIEWWFTSPHTPTDKKYTTDAIDWASDYGHVDMVEWWFTSPHAPEDKKYTANAIAMASANGHVNMVEWWFTSPHAPKDKKYTAYAIDGASANGHVDMVEWWFTSPHAPEDKEYTEDAIDRASQMGHVDMVEWWFTSPHAPKDKKYTSFAINWANANGHVDMVEWWFTSPHAPTDKKYTPDAIDCKR